MARVCVVRCHYFRDTRLQREVVALLDRGHSVHLLCLRDAGEPLRERRGRLIISRIPVRHSAGAGMARRLAEYSIFFALAGIGVTALHLRNRFDLVQVNSVPDALVFVALIPHLTGAPVLLDLHEPLPEFFASKARVGERHPAVRLIAAIEQASIRFADATLAVTEPMRQAFIGRGASPDKITVVMDGADEQIFDATRFPRRNRDDDKFVLVSHGTIEPRYGLDTAIRAIALLAEDIPSLELQIIGDGSQRSELQSLACELGVANRVTFSRGFIPIDKLVSTLTTADIGVVAVTQDPFRDLALAGKMFDYITMGIPMVVSTTRSVEQAFPPGCFEPFRSGDPSDLARAIKRLHDDPCLASSYATRVKEAARPYSWPAQRQRYWEVVDTLLNNATTTDAATLSVTLTRSPDRSVLAAWDDLVRKVPGSDVAQLSAWAEIRRGAGFEPQFVFAWRDGQLVGGALVMSRRLPLIGDVGYVPYGPMIGPEADRQAVISVLTDALRRLTRQRMRMIIIQPPPGGEDISVQLLQRGFRRTTVNIAPAASIRLDLSRGEEELWAGLPKRLRRRARKWPEQGVRVRRGSQADVALLARLHAATAHHQGFQPIPRDYLETLYRCLAPAGHAELFIGEIEGKPVVAQFVTCCGGVVKARLTGMDRSSEAGRLRVSTAVLWEAIHWSKANGYNWFDFGGVREAAVSILEDEWADRSALTSSEEFKASFGGAPFRYPPPLEIISPPMIRIAYDLTQRWPAGRRLVERLRTTLRLPSIRSGGSAVDQAK